MSNTVEALAACFKYLKRVWNIYNGFEYLQRVFNNSNVF